MPLASASLTYPAKALNWHFITASYLFKIYVSLEIDGSSGSFRATCAYSSLNVRRNWNFRPSVIVSCLFARTAGGCVDLVLDQAARRLRQTPRGFRFASQRTYPRRLSCPTPNMKWVSLRKQRGPSPLGTLPCVPQSWPLPAPRVLAALL